MLNCRWKGGDSMAVIRGLFTLRIDIRTHAKIRKIAGMERRSMTNIIELMLTREIEQYELEHGEIRLTDDDIYGKPDK
jgi:predicted HicB family RNase H-like nuclease